MNKILSYRGLLEHAGQDTILLSTKQGEKGYRIRKFQTITAEPGTSSSELVTQIWSVEQTTISSPTTIDFSNQQLLGIAYNALSANLQGYQNILFGNTIFNQDIYITNVDNLSGGNDSVNYYLELEVIPLNEMEATVATLKDIRNNA